MITIYKVIYFFYPILIPIGLAILTAQISLIANKAERWAKAGRGEGVMLGWELYNHKSASDSIVFEYKYPFLHELSMSLAFAYISYDIWASITLVERYTCPNIIAIKICAYLITISLLLHFINLLYRAQYGTHSLDYFRWSILHKRLIVWLNLFSILSLFVISRFLG